MSPFPRARRTVQFGKGKGYRGHHTATPDEVWHLDTDRCEECEREDRETAERIARGEYAIVAAVDAERGVITLRGPSDS